MKRNVFILALTLLFQFSVMQAAVNEDEKRTLQQPVTAESLIKGAARIKSDQIDYAYISTAMFKQIFSLLDGNMKLGGGYNRNGSGKIIRVNKKHTPFCDDWSRWV